VCEVLPAMPVTDGLRMLGFRVLRHDSRLISCRSLAAQWKMNLELAVDLASLALYDIVIYAGAS